MKKDTLGKEEVARYLEDLINGTGTEWDWDDFTSGMSLDDEYLETIRRRVANLGREFPTDKRHKWANEQGLDVIRAYIKELRDEPPQ